MYILELYVTLHLSGVGAAVTSEGQRLSWSVVS